MEAFICTACGTQYTPSSVAPRQCVICEEERQYVPPRGQTWTTLAALTVGHFNSYRQYEPGVIGIGTQPQFAIGCDPPPLKWSDLRYVFDIKEDCNDKEAIQA